MATLTQPLPARLNPSAADRLIGVLDRLKTPLFYFIMIAWGVIALAPLYFTLVFSLKPVANAYTPPIYWPTPFTLDNYRTVVESFDLFPRWLLNSTVIALGVTALRALFCSMAGYAFARLEFPLKRILFAGMLIGMMLPGQVTLITNFLVVGPGVFRNLTVSGVKIPTGFGLIDNPLGVILPGMATAFFVFMMTQFYKSLPKELEEAAMIDGSSRFGVFFRIILPLSQTQLLTLALLSFQGAWNEFLFPLIVLRTPANFTLPLGLQWFRGEYYTLYSIVLAGSLFNTLPILLLFFAFQKYFVQNIATTGMKEA